MYRTHIKDKHITLYPSSEKDAPLIVLHVFEENEPIYEAIKEKTSQPFSLLVIAHLDWDADMSPWIAPPLFKGDHGCSGKADLYLETLLNEIMPWALSHLENKPTYKALAGYSLAGLFSIYALYHTDIFSRIASASGSFWFPNFLEYVKDHELKEEPDYIYFSLGDKEARTRHALLKTVEEHTASLVSYYKEKGIKTDFEMNPGNHIQDAMNRMAKAIASLLEETLS